MRPDPHPGDATGLHYADGAIVMTDPDRKQVVGAPQFSEVQRRMGGRYTPELVVLFSQPLNLSRQFCE